MKNTKILIVGAGPVGLIMALSLKQYGITPDIIEKRMGTAQHSKALSINAASLKVLEHLELIEQFITSGKKCQHIYTYWHERKLMHIDYSRLKSKFNFFLALPQSETEKILSDQLKKNDIIIQYGVELNHIKENKDNIKTRLTNRKKQSIYKEYDYVIACDGGKSTVRKQLDLPFPGHDYNITFKMIDCEIDWNGNKSATHYFISDNGFIILIPLSDKLNRIVFKTEKSDSTKSVAESSSREFQQLLNKYGPNNLIIRNIIWKTQGPFYNRLIDNYRFGNIFFAGDSSHLFSPIGGLGMNTGIQDAFNLSWKLAGVIYGDYPEKLLKTYSKERREIGKQLITSTDITTQLVTRTNHDLVEESNLEAWLPKMSNRQKIRSTYPLHFSGLGQTYANNEKIIPYASALDINGNVVDSYQLINDYKVKILIFTSSIDEINYFKNLYPTTPFIIIIKNENIAFKNETDILLVDSKCEFYNAFAAKTNNAYLLRADGFFEPLSNEKSQVQNFTL